MTCCGCGEERRYSRLCGSCRDKRARLRNRQALAMRAEGLTYKEIGVHFGVSVDCARQYVCRGDREYSSHIKVYGDGLYLGLPERMEGWQRSRMPLVA